LPADDLVDEPEFDVDFFFAPDDEPLLLPREVELEPPLLLPALVFPVREVDPVFELDVLPDEVDEDDRVLPVDDEERPLSDLDRALLPVEREADLRPPVDLLDPDPLRPDGVIVSAAAPTAPTAAPAAAPLSISPATSITLSTITVVVDFVDDEPRFDEDELFFEFPEFDLLAINFPP
jgi:hypothetical protein